MKQTFIMLATMLCFAAFQTFAENADYRVVPLPDQINLQNGKSFTISKKTKITYPKGNEKLKRNAAFLAQYIKENTGLALKTKQGKASRNTIFLQTSAISGNKEAYNIHVSPKNIIISGTTEAGVFYGIQTLRKSIPVKQTAKIEMPAVQISDAPRFGYRGMMLDASRHFSTLDSVKRWIDMLVLHNMNVFHWHLTDDQGWRIEIKKYPGLTEIGSKRTETVIGRNTGKYDGIPHGGFYTQAEAREIVAYAAERYIDVIPEIDMPGHMLGALAPYPELGCTGGPYEVWRMWGISDDVLCMGNPKTFTFITDVLNEIMDIFQSKYVHIGGDECPKTNWKKCPKCQAKITELGLKADEHHTAEERLQSHFITYADKVVNARGRKIIGWDEILEGGLAPNATVMSWRGMGGGIEAAKLGHDVIMTPNTHLYFDYYQTKDTKEEPLAIGGFSSVENVYNLQPQPSSLTEEQKNRIIGVQANLWREYIKSFRHAEYMVMPRMAALSEVQWTKTANKNYDDFLKRLLNLIEIYKQNNYNYAKHLFDISADFVPKDGALHVTLKTMDDAPIYYTTDGTTPDKTAKRYTGVFKIKKDADLKAVVIRGDEKSRILNEKITYSKASMKKIKALQPVNRQYQYRGISTLVDGLKGTENYRTGRWIGFLGNDLEAVIDLETPTEITEIIMSAYVVKGDWIFGARSLSILSSVDGENFSPLASEKYPVLNQTDRNGIYEYKLEFNQTKTRYVKIVAETEKSMPEWHGGRGKPAFLFVDEITLR